MSHGDSSADSQHRDEFQDLWRRVRAGESAAAAELVRRYEPEIRRTIRVRLTDPRLRRVVDSMDVCQSVLGRFFVRASLGALDIDRPEDLLGLLATMVRNRVADHARREQAGRRDQRRVAAGGDSVLHAIAGAAPPPDQRAADRELLDEVRRRLAPDERQLADARAIGRSWQELAAEFGGTPDALRKKLSRALDRVAAELGLDEDAAYGER